MRKKVLILLVVVAGITVWLLLGRARGEEEAYRLVTIGRGDVESVVSSTGALQAITTVEVGTQVSGQIAEIFVDFNDHVTEGQLVARIDPVLLEQEVRSAEANVERNKAELDQAARELARMERLYRGEVVTESEYTTAEYQHAVASASYKSAQISLERARRNLGYTEIRAPIDGVVLDRTVDVGQTVAASFSAPQLFLIAEDLSAMEILAAVDESDIGEIYEGQEVRFTVQAYPDESFSGTVGQVRLQSTNEENVVNYTVAIAVENPDGRLLPGMTATVEFVVSRAADVFTIANSALRFRPTTAMSEALRGRRESARADGADSASGRPLRAEGDSASRGLLWYVDDDGELNAAPVRTGITDGQITEIEGPWLEEGMQIIAAVTSGSSSSSVNPFQSRTNNDRRPGPPPGM